MGECLITRRGGENYKLPILNANYPQDVSTTVVKGNTGSATFLVDISEPGNPAVYTYQWYVNGVAVEGANGSGYTKDDLTETGTYTVYCEVTNKKGTVSSRIATLEVNQNYTPVLDANYPQNATVVIAESVTAEVVITTDGNPDSYTYQWYKDDVLVVGANSSSYTFTPEAVGTSTLRCDVTNSAGTVSSRVATVETEPYYIFNSGVFADGGSYGYKGNDDEDYVTLTDGILKLYDQSTGSCVLYTTQKYDLTNRKTLKFTCPKLFANNNDSGSTFNFGVSGSQSDTAFSAKYSCPGYTSNEGKTISLDVSGLTGSYYIKVATIRDVYHNDEIYVSKIYCE